jgi:hypothetical protein
MPTKAHAPWRGQYECEHRDKKSEIASTPTVTVIHLPPCGSQEAR